MPKPYHPNQATIPLLSYFTRPTHLRQNYNLSPSPIPLHNAMRLLNLLNLVYLPHHHRQPPLHHILNQLRQRQRMEILLLASIKRVTRTLRQRSIHALNIHTPHNAHLTDLPTLPCAAN